MKTINLLTLIITLTLFTANAQEMVKSRVTLTQAVTIADTAMKGYNDGDYAAWSINWSDKMKAAIKDNTFKAARQDLIGKLGKFLYFSRVELTKAKTAGFVRWEFVGIFEKGSYKFTWTFPQDSDQVEGVLTEAVK